MNHNESDLDSILAEFSDFSPGSSAEKTINTEPPKTASANQKAASVSVRQARTASRAETAVPDTPQDYNSPVPARNTRRSGTHYIPPEPVPQDEPAPKAKKKLSKKQKRKRRNIITLILVCLLILAGAAGIYLTLTHKSATNTVRQEINLTERVEKNVDENEAATEAANATETHA